MKTFKNKMFKKRDYECTQIVFCQAEVPPSDIWIESTETEIRQLKCQQLRVSDNVRYFGYL